MSQHRRLVARSRHAVSADELFAWHAREGALERLAAPWEPVRVVSRSGGLKDGGRVAIEMHVAGMPVRWEAVHFGYEEGRVFRDRQQSGPFAFWEHSHRVTPLEGGTDARSELQDEVEYELPVGRLGDVLGGESVSRRLVRLFAYRHRQLARDLTRHARAAAAGADGLTVAVSGASGMIGESLCALLQTGGHRVKRLVRPRSGVTAGEQDIRWDPAAGTIDESARAGVQAVVHRAGGYVGAGPRTPGGKRRMRDSREKGRTLLATAHA